LEKRDRGVRGRDEKTSLADEGEKKCPHPGPVGQEGADGLSLGWKRELRKTYGCRLLKGGSDVEADRRNDSEGDGYMDGDIFDLVPTEGRTTIVEFRSADKWDS
jgi:hypothetical protein